MLQANYKISYLQIHDFARNVMKQQVHEALLILIELVQLLGAQYGQGAEQVNLQ
jgi:hypothetical protein